MRFLLTTTAALGLAAIAASSAFAADSSTASTNWTGPYVGGQLGYAWQPRDGKEGIKADTNQDGTFGDPFPAFSGYCGGSPLSGSNSTGCGKDNDATSWKVHAGYDYQFGDTSGPVVGAVIEGGRAYLYDNVTAFSTTGNVYKIQSKLRETGAIRGRAGYSLSTGTLVYGTGGLAYGKIRNSFSTSNTVNSFTADGGSKSAWGYNYGGGIEQKVGKFSVGALYLFTSLKNNKYDVNAAGGPAGNAFIATNAGGTDLKRDFTKFGYHQVLATVSYHF